MPRRERVPSEAYMATLTITNISGGPIYLPSLQVGLDDAQQHVFERALPELEAMPVFMRLFEAGSIQVDVVAIETWELHWRNYLALSTGPDGAYALTNATRTIHEGIVTVSDAEPQPGQGPTPVVVNAVLGYAFTPGAPGVGDAAFRMIKIPSNFVSDPTFHVHWTKNVDTDQQGNTVRFRISYLVFDGITDDVNVAPTVIDIDDTYNDAGTTTRIVHRTGNNPATGFVANYYLGLKIEALTAGTTLSGDVVIVSADLLYKASINQGT